MHIKVGKARPSGHGFSHIRFPQSKPEGEPAGKPQLKILGNLIRGVESPQRIMGVASPQSVCVLWLLAAR